MADTPKMPTPVGVQGDDARVDLSHGTSGSALAGLFASFPLRNITRDEADFRERMAAKIRRDPTRYMYGWNVKNRDGTTSRVEGATIEMAMDCAREYKSCFAGAVDVRDLGSHWLITAVFIDRINDVIIPRDFMQRKVTTSMGRMDADRQADVVFQIAQSKAIRNAVINGLRGYIDEFLDICKDGALDWVKGHMPECERILQKVVTRYDIELKDIERRIGRPKNKWTVPDWTQVISEMRSIEDGMIRAEELYRGVEPGPTVDGTATEVEDEPQDQRPTSTAGAAPKAAKTRRGSAAAKKPEPAKPTEPEPAAEDAEDAAEEQAAGEDAAAEEAEADEVADETEEEAAAEDEAAEVEEPAAPAELDDGWKLE